MTGHRPTVQISEVASTMYEVLAAAADDRGFVSFEQCMEISISGVPPGTQVEAARELQRELLIFHSSDDAGWYLRLPLREVEVQGEP